MIKQDVYFFCPLRIPAKMSGSYLVKKLILKIFIRQLPVNVAGRCGDGDEQGTKKKSFSIKCRYYLNYNRHIKKTLKIKKKSGYRVELGQSACVGPSSTQLEIMPEVDIMVLLLE